MSPRLPGPGVADGESVGPLGRGPQQAGGNLTKAAAKKKGKFPMLRKQHKLQKTGVEITIYL